jgi:hypothetical protein
MLDSIRCVQTPLAENCQQGGGCLGSIKSGSFCTRCTPVRLSGSKTDDISVDLVSFSDYLGCSASCVNANDVRCKLQRFQCACVEQCDAHLKQIIRKHC